MTFKNLIQPVPVFPDDDRLHGDQFFPVIDFLRDVLHQKDRDPPVESMAHLQESIAADIAGDAFFLVISDVDGI